MYSEKVMEHFNNPRNVGEIKDADAVGEVGNPVCGDIIKLYLKIKDDTIEDIKFKTFGCGAAVATSSMVTELVKGKKIDEALKVSKETVAEALDGLPSNKMHCSNLAADALHKAIKSYNKKDNSDNSGKENDTLDKATS
ncbi:Fe-S cluster assembly scaffold protein NifU [Halothermothrix orenii]|uniref:Nitrogen-fixing NifU domain protein n=1 Tax=Halothermothrix orenii (strain H 168 / OCM 544 / DSM 9562) TaxID=373903 RepID=B8CWH6_HALOH|nr:Fe-S cluster assembly scaffold protein NifU [Halothermothrix orenii]ACL69645.1 nitrogen-fixing NifU domain protein [Halothermothrix orenii H 168]